ncbi:MAG: hypothetical protein B7X34_00005 [Acidobacteriia bacterium 12-62-4]|nr:MAG: hypothetical protein B7X34_00005 [Acidobacteriia bacterium 12-62-4]
MANSINGFTALGVQNSNPQFQNPFVINPKVNYSKILSKHSLKAGYEYQSIDTDIDDFNPKYGNVGFSGRFSQAPGTPNDDRQFVADYLFGARSNYSLNTATIVNYRQRMHFLYLQDDFKVSRRLTLNLGLRYEFATLQDDAVVSFWQPDLSKCGGVSEAMRIAAMASARGITVNPHTSATALNMVTTVHFLSAVDNPGYFEADVTLYNPFRDELGDTAPYTLDAEGCVQASARAGLGVQVDEAFLAAHPLIDGPCYV